jgi:hypothetical protein
MQRRTFFWGVNKRKVFFNNGKVVLEEGDGHEEECEHCEREGEDHVQVDPEVEKAKGKISQEGACATMIVSIGEE